MQKRVLAGLGPRLSAAAPCRQVSGGRHGRLRQRLIEPNQISCRHSRKATRNSGFQRFLGRGATGKYFLFSRIREFRITNLKFYDINFTFSKSFNHSSTPSFLQIPFLSGMLRNFSWLARALLVFQHEHVAVQYRNT
ncbi:MAG: hypothetical protein WAK57_15820 [Desulfobacterales bacterium]